MGFESSTARFAQRVAQLCDRLWLSRWLPWAVLSGWAAIIVPNLGRESLWLDELFSAYSSFTPRTLRALFTEHVLKDVHPPLYPVFLYYWGRWVGQSELVARLPSALSLAAGLFGSYALLTPIVARRQAALYLLTLGFSAGTVYYAQELRCYGLLLGVSAVLSALYLRFRAEIELDRAIATRFAWLYVASGILAVYTHLYANLLIAALALPLLWAAKQRGQTENLVRLLAVHAAIGASSALWLFLHFAAGPLASKLQGHFWIREADLGAHLQRFVGLVLGNGWSLSGYAVLGLTVLVLIRKGATFEAPSPRLAPVFLVLAFALALSVHTPTITARNLIVTLPLLALFVAEMADTAYSLTRAPVLLFIALLVLGGSVYSFRYEKTQWREAALYVREHFSPERCLVPVRDLIDPDHGQDFSIYPSYYLADRYRFSSRGPALQPGCDLILYDAHLTDRAGVAALLAKYGIQVPHTIVPFRGAYVVVRRAPGGH